MGRYLRAKKIEMPIVEAVFRRIKTVAKIGSSRRASRDSLLDLMEAGEVQKGEVALICTLCIPASDQGDHQAVQIPSSGNRALLRGS